MNNITTTTILMLMTGAVLIYSSVKKMDPRDVVRKALGKEPKFGFFGIDSGPNATRDIIPLPGKGGGGVPRFTGLTGGTPPPLLGSGIVPNV